jgi:hypothetical protein
LVWLLTIIKRITAQAKPKPEKHHLVTSDTLYALEIGLMDGAITNANAVKNRSAARALGGRCGPTPIHRRHRRGHKFVISLRVRRRPERRCWFTPGRLTAADLQVRVQELQHYRLARRSCEKSFARLAQFPCGCRPAAAGVP